MKERPLSVYRVSIFNQIFYTKYYHVRRYDLNQKTGKYRPTMDVCGHRGPGGHLGLGYAEACELAGRWNRREGWNSVPNSSLPPFDVQV